MSIGILGGTFDPIHLGHLHLASEVHKEAKLSFINIVPCFQSPLRQKPIATPKQRLEMAELAISDKPYLLLDNQEITREGISYTIDTLRTTQINLKNTLHKSLSLIMGIDAFNKFNYWHEWENILELANLIIVNRQNIKISLKNEIKNLLNDREISDPIQLKSNPCGKILMLDINPLPISATNIRNLIANGNFEEAKNMLSPNVWQYIITNKIYF